MIKTKINITYGENTCNDCDLIVPSQVLTSTKQEETLDLTKSPNFQIIVPGTYIDNNGKFEVTFTIGEDEYTANMVVVNNGSVNCTLQYVDGLTVEEAAVPSFTYDGSDQNNPIQIDVDLNGFNATDIRINPNLSVPEGIQYLWTEFDTWTPDIAPGLYSDTNDFPIVGQFSDVFCPQSDVDSNNNQFWLNGPTTAGTYLKSYTLTFVYNKEFSDIYDENDEHLDDPVAQALDGTVVTFWVQYNVTEHQETLSALTLKWGGGAMEGLTLSDYHQNDPFTPGMGITIRFFDENDNDVTENIVNNHTINVNFVGYDGNNYSGTTYWENIEAEAPQVDHALDIRFANQEEFNTYVQTYQNEHEDPRGMSTQCNISVDGYSVSPEGFTIMGDTW